MKYKTINPNLFCILWEWVLKFDKGVFFGKLMKFIKYFIKIFVYMENIRLKKIANTYQGVLSRSQVQASVEGDIRVIQDLRDNCIDRERSICIEGTWKVKLSYFYCKKLIKKF